MNFTNRINLHWRPGGEFSRIGVDIGARTTKIVQLRHNSRGTFANAAATFPTVVQSDAREAIRTTARRVAEVLQRQGFRGRNVVLLAPSNRVQSELLELPPRSSGAPLEILARAELSRSGSLSSAPFEMASWDLPALSRGGASTSVMAVGLRHGDAEQFLEAFADAGMSVCAIDIAAWACARACMTAAPPAEMTAILDLGWEAARLVLVGQSTVIYQRDLNEVGRGAVHRQLATSLQVPDDVVEYAIDAIGLTSGAEVDGIDPGEVTRLRAHLVRHVDSIVTELKTSFAFASHRYPELPLKRLFIGGGGASIKGLEAALNQRARIETKIWTPGVAAQCDGLPADRSNDPSLMTALGLALHKGD